jgi:hypothetical protein
MNKQIVSIFLMALLISPNLCAIRAINILKIGEKGIGLYGNFDISLNRTSGNSETENYKLGIFIENFHKKDLWLFNATHYFEQSSQIKTANKSYVHLRNIREMSKPSNSSGGSDWEYFGQIEHNEFLRLEFRGLLGTGLRFKPFVDANFYLGAGPMLVRENYSDGRESQTFGKLNIYINVKSAISDATSVSYVVYYQPNMDKMNNFELVQSFELENKISKKFSLVIKLSHDYDSNPVDAVEKYDFEQTTAFRYKF